MYNYWQNIFLFLKKLPQEVERICSSFLRKEEVGSAGAKVSWKYVCRPKDGGGLGLGRLIDWNKTTLAHIVWMLFKGSNPLWIACIKAFLLRGERF